MPARHAVPLTTPKADVCLAAATLLESTLVEVFIRNSLNLFRMNTFCGSPRFAQFWCNLTPFRINTCKSVSKQTTLSPFRMNTGSVDILGIIAMREIDKEALVVFSDEAGGTMAEVGLLPFARVALQVATQVLPLYRTRFSKHQFTQPQLRAVHFVVRFDTCTL